MTRSEAEEFIQTVIENGECLDLNEVMKKYQGKTLREALTDYYFEVDPFGDHLDEIVGYKGPDHNGKR